MRKGGSRVKLTDLCTARPCAGEEDMVRIDSLTAIPRWEERTILHEGLLTIAVDGRDAARLVCSPQELSALTLGYLFSSGRIQSAAEVVSVTVNAEGSRAEVETTRPRRAGRRKTVPSTGCPPTGLEGCAPLPPFSWEPRWVYGLARAFHEGAPLYNETHGIHSCFLMYEEDIRYVCEDIGRHNALDKAIGRALLDGLDLSQCVLFSSGRIPADMMEKVIRARVPMLISNAVPTDKAVALARQYRVILICSARRDAMNIFSDKSIWQYLPYAKKR